MVTPGLASVTFEQLSCREILARMVTAQLTAVEWSGSVHAPHGDLACAAEVAAMTRDAGIRCCSYGSYYSAGESEQAGLSFARVLETALALGVSTIRVWAGERGSADADAAYRAAVITDLRRIAEMAAAAGVAIAVEYHSGTLTDTDPSARQLALELAHANAWLYWQPPVGWSHEGCLHALQAIMPRVGNLHVFHWQADGARRPFVEGAARWRAYFQAVAMSGRDHYALLEFVRGDDPRQLLADAAALHRLLDAR